MTDEDFFCWLLEQEPFPGAEIRDLQDGTYLMAKPLLFHWTLTRGVIGDTFAAYFDRWCYQTEEGAKQALKDFPDNPPSSYEPTGWHRHPISGRRRLKGNPDTEYIDP